MTLERGCTRTLQTGSTLEDRVGIGVHGNYSVGHSVSGTCKRAGRACACARLSFSLCVQALRTRYLLQMNVLVDNSLVPLGVLCLLGVPGPSFAVSTVKQEVAE